MPKPKFIELGEGKWKEQIPILYEDRSVLAIDKPPTWMLVPFNWQKTNRNLLAAITSSIAAGDFWARSRNLKFLRNIHRLDAETSGVLLFGKSQGAVESFSEMFESRRIDKTYLAVVHGAPKQPEWISTVRIGEDANQIGRMRADERNGRDCETHFKLLKTRTDVRLGAVSLIEARPITGRTHQIRIHLSEAGLPIFGDPLYGKGEVGMPLGLRSIFLGYMDPFTRKPVKIRAPSDAFVREFGFEPLVREKPAAPLAKDNSTKS